MGYTTDFSGKFTLNKKLDDVTLTFLKDLAGTRRMARNVDAKYGVEGEFYVKDDELHLLHDCNTPPSTQPSLWCQWIPTEDGLGIEWDGGEKFYEYVEWLKYIIDKILAPKGYVLNGRVHFQGEDSSDFGYIVAKDNVVTIDNGHQTYDSDKEEEAEKPIPEPINIEPIKPLKRKVNWRQ